MPAHVPSSHAQSESACCASLVPTSEPFLGPCPHDGAAPGTERVVDGVLRVFYQGYWIKAYEEPADTLLAKKWLIEALTRRLFNHVEHGLNVPGTRLEEARLSYDSESDSDRKRVKGAMLAGALFNRAADVFTRLVELQSLGVQIEPDNALMVKCGEHLQEALVLGKMVLHRSGEEGIDELWGEPFKAFAYPIHEFYKSRYVKIAATMAAIDRIVQELLTTFEQHPMFLGIGPLLRAFAHAAKRKSETLRTDTDIFDVWTSFVVCGEHLSQFEPLLPPCPTMAEGRRASSGIQLVREGKDLVFYITRARVPMPKSTREFIERCEGYRNDHREEASRSDPNGRSLWGEELVPPRPHTPLATPPLDGRQRSLR